MTMTLPPKESFWVRFHWLRLGKKVIHDFFDGFMQTDASAVTSDQRSDPESIHKPGGGGRGRWSWRALG